MLVALAAQEFGRAAVPRPLDVAGQRPGRHGPVVARAVVPVAELDLDAVLGVAASSAASGRQPPATMEPTPSQRRTVAPRAELAHRGRHVRERDHPAGDTVDGSRKPASPARMRRSSVSSIHFAPAKLPTPSCPCGVIVTVAGVAGSVDLQPGDDRAVGRAPLDGGRTGIAGRVHLHPVELVLEPAVAAAGRDEAVARGQRRGRAAGT